MRQGDGRMIVLSDTGFHAAAGAPTTLKRGQRGEWQDRRLVETVRALLLLVCHLQQGLPRVGADFQARLAFTMATFHGLVPWPGFQP
jgi:hypothetical protein